MLRVERGIGLTANAGCSLFLLFLTSCAGPTISIPSGTYLSRATRERVVVTPSKIFFDGVRYMRSETECRCTGEFDYVVTSDGHVHPFFRTSGEMFFLGSYRWQWDGRSLTKSGWTHWTKGPPSRFVLQ